MGICSGGYTELAADLHRKFHKPFLTVKGAFAAACDAKQLSMAMWWLEHEIHTVRSDLPLSMYAACRLRNVDVVSALMQRVGITDFIQNSHNNNNSQVPYSSFTGGETLVNFVCTCFV